MGRYGSTKGHSAPASGSEEAHEYKDPDMLPKVNKADMAGTMEFIKEYL